jgi:hypothetical protein
MGEGSLEGWRVGEKSVAWWVGLLDSLSLNGGVGEVEIGRMGDQPEPVIEVCEGKFSRREQGEFP